MTTTIELVEAIINVELNESAGITIELEDVTGAGTTELVDDDSILEIIGLASCISIQGEAEQVIELVSTTGEIEVTELEERIELISALSNPALALPANMFAALCTLAEAVNDLVYISATGAVRKVDIDDSAKMPAAGVIISKSSDTDCVVQFSGILETATGLTAGARYWVGPSATLTTPRPADPLAGLRALQVVGNALSATSLVLNMDQTLMKVIP